MSLVTVEELLRIFKNADDDMRKRLSRAVRLVEENADPRFVKASFTFDDSFALGGVTLAGKDIKKHLEGCSEVFVGVCTLGAGIDRLIERLKVTDLSAAYLLDIAASFAAENLTENSWKSLVDAAEKRGMKCTTRYSCGYGDFDLSQQKDLLEISGADRALSIRVNDGGMMYPTKSVTFLCGLKNDDGI